LAKVYAESNISLFGVQVLVLKIDDHQNPDHAVVQARTGIASQVAPPGRPRVKAREGFETSGTGEAN
jgi:hypothetical protein